MTAPKAILPLGSYEDHGSLPPDTDTSIAACLASRIADRSGWEPLPALPYGFSPEHSPRAVSIGAATYVELLRSLILSSGRGSVLIVNAHGGNWPLARAVSFELLGRARVEVLDVWDSVLSILGARGALVHAGPVEASLASACGVEPVGYAEVPRARIEELARSAARSGPALEVPWRSSELPGLVREYSRELGEWLAEGLVEVALRPPGGGQRL
ncbi:MAG: creatininase family protein [Conexivisphaera sp.]